MTRGKELAALVAIVVATGIALFALRKGELPREPPATGSAAASSEPPRPEPAASPRTLAALGGLGPGDPVGPFVITSVSDPAHGAIVVRTREGAVFEVRLLAEDRPPPATARGLGVYYRTMRVGASYPPEQLVAAAQAIAARIDGTPADTPMPPGLTVLPPDPGQPL